MATGSPTVVFRATSSGLVFGAVVLGSAVLLGDAVARLRWDVVAAALPAVTLVVWAGWLVFLRPCLLVGGAGLTVVNVFRTTVVPWNQVEAVTTRFQVVVTLASGKRLRCWGAPIAARRALPGLGGQAPGSPVQALVDSRLDGFGQGRRPTGVVLRRWNLLPIGVGVALALVVAGQLAAAGSRLP